MHSIALFGHFLVEVFGQLVEELERVEVIFPLDVGDGSALDAQSQIFSHESGLNRIDANVFQTLAKSCQGLVTVQLGAMGQAPGPREYGSDRIGRGLLSGLHKDTVNFA